MKSVFYREGYKYQLARACQIKLPAQFHPEKPVKLPFITLSKTGVLSMKAGYAWDGASGPAVDRKATKRGSLVHDALYQLLRMEKLPQDLRHDADHIYSQLCAEDGMWAWWARRHLNALSLFGGPSADPANRREEQEAP
jgi:hypothetical protein